MKQLDEMKEIKKLLTLWYTEISFDNKASNFNDINKASENIALKLLNEIYGYELENLNYEKSNHSDIDLGDRKKTKIAFQVTSRVDAKKITNTLNNFVKRGFDKLYSNGIRFFILNVEVVKLGKHDYTAIYDKFNKDRDIITFRKIINDIEKIYNNDLNKFYRIKKVLTSEIGEYNFYLKRAKEKFYFKFHYLRPKVIFTLFVIVLLMTARIFNPDGLSMFLSIIKFNMPGIIGFSLFVAIVFILLRISDRDFQRLLKEHYPETDNYESREEDPVMTKVFMNNHKRKMTISLKNSHSKMLKNLKGKVVFYNNRVKVFEAKFSEDAIYPLKETIIFEEEFLEYGKNILWNEFQTYINEVTIEGVIKQDITVFGYYFIRTYYLILNKFNYFRLWKFKIPYEISWLKDQWHRNVMRWFFRACNTPRRVVIGYSENHEPFSYKIIRVWKKTLRAAILVIIAGYIFVSFKAVIAIISSLLSIYIDILFKFKA